MATDPNTIGASRFTEFVGTPGVARLGLVNTHVEQNSRPYVPVRDPYRPMLRAITNGRRTGADAATVWGLVDTSAPQRQTLYTEIAEGWLRYVPTLGDTEVLTAKRGRWRSPALTVRVSPDLVVRHTSTGQVKLLRLYVRAAPLSQEKATTMWWLLDQVADDLYPGSTVAVVDVRRGREVDPLPGSAAYHAWMQSEALSYTHMCGLVDEAA